MLAHRIVGAQKSVELTSEPARMILIVPRVGKRESRHGAGRLAQYDKGALGRRVDDSILEHVRDDWLL